MRKLFLLIFIACLFVACSDDDDKSDNNLQVSTQSVVLDKKTTFVDVEILKGNGAYLATSTEQSVARVNIEGNTVRIFGFSEGKSTIKIYDQNENTVSIEVNVREKIDRPDVDAGTLLLKKGEQRQFDFKNFDKECTVHIQDESIVSATITDKTVTLSGKKTGTTKLVIKQNEWIINDYTISIVDKYDLGVATEFNLSFHGETPPTVGVYIYSGSGNYAIESGDETIGTATIAPYEEKTPNNWYNPATIWFNSRKAGEVTYTLTDLETGQTAAINFHITNSADK